MPDIERIIADHYRTTLAASVTVGTELPRDKSFPFVRVHRFGGGTDPRVPVTHLDRALIQVDVWADTVSAAWALADQCRTELDELPHQPASGGVVTGVRTEEFRRVEDPSFTPAQPRYSVRATVYAHP